MSTLITFLGRAPRTENGYRRTRYDFGAGEPAEELAFFGWALHRRIGPRRIVVLGTTGSMWDHLFEGDLDVGASAERERLELIEAVATQSVDQRQLDVLAPTLGEHLRCEVRLALIPYCRNEVEQVEVLRVISEHIDERDAVHLDITHGFRHLPVLVLLAALHVRLAKRARIEGIWYGAYDPDTGGAPVHDLSGLMRIADGLMALASFDKDADYGVFAGLLERAGLSQDHVRALRKASYYENILNVSAATGELRKAMRGFGELAPHPETALVVPLVGQRLDWLNEERQFEKQTRLARRAWERRDYLRATLYAYESVITRLCLMANVAVEDFDAREDARSRYEERLRACRGDENQDYQLLKNLRNQVAHGTRGNVRSVQAALLDEHVMRDSLRRLIDAIEAGKLPSVP